MEGVKILLSCTEQKLLVYHCFAIQLRLYINLKRKCPVTDKYGFISIFFQQMQFCRKFRIKFSGVHKKTYPELADFEFDQIYKNIKILSCILEWPDHK